MSEEQNLKTCPRCESQNPVEHNFCWLCGLELNQQTYDHPTQAPARSNKAAIAASVGTGVFGVLAGAMGGVVIGAMIVIALVVSVLNSIGEMLESCSGMLIFMSLTASAVFYSILSWLF